MDFSDAPAISVALDPPAQKAPAWLPACPRQARQPAALLEGGREADELRCLPLRVLVACILKLPLNLRWKAAPDCLQCLACLALFVGAPGSCTVSGPPQSCQAWRRWALLCWPP